MKKYQVELKFYDSYGVIRQYFRWFLFAKNKKQLLLFIGEKVAMDTYELIENIGKLEIKTLKND